MDLKSLLEGLEKLLGLLFGGQPPAWLLPAVAWAIAIGFLLRGLLYLLNLLQKLWTEFIRPVYYRPEDKRRAARRHMFADYIESEIRRLNALEAWNDNRFAELEAEVEAEGGRKLFEFFKPKDSSVSGLRKEKSLSRALKHSSERLILVEGDPGSGKSVALRHLAQHMAHAAFSSRNLKSTIPLYINLKHLRRQPDQAIDQHLMYDFVFKSLNRINDRDVEEFLAEEFKRGLEDGTWLFLFDSFDEIPDILSSTEADQIIRAYAEAISDFLHGMNTCRGIVASREYKGPRFLGWPKFRILPLTMDRKIELIKRTGMKLQVQKQIIHGISQSTTDFRYLTGNAMFLNLLCEYMNKKEIPDFPQHTHHIFNDYVWKRLQHDQERLQQRFSKTPEQIREAAEKLAFCMTADTGIGLSPTIEQLEQSTRSLGLTLGTEFQSYVNAIEYLKLARIEAAVEDGQRYFTFAHRRFQEYFATAVVLREPERLNITTLLTDARWRETAVVILQTQPQESLSPLFAEIDCLLTKNASEFRKENEIGPVPDPTPPILPPYRLGQLGKNLFERIDTSRNKIKTFIQLTEAMIEVAEKESQMNCPLNWPESLFHVLGILQEGLSTRYDLIPERTREVIDTFILAIMRRGSLDDRKWALDVAGCASLPVVEQAIDIGFSSPGNWVKNSALLQVSRLAHIPQKFSQQIVSNLLMSAQEEILLRRRYEIFAQFSRFANTDYMRVASLIIWMPVIDLCLNLISALLLFGIIRTNLNSIFLTIGMSTALFLSAAGFLIRWRSSTILKMIADTYSTRFANSSSRYYQWFTKRFRVKQSRRADKSLSEKLMSLVLGLIFSVAGVFTFLAITFSMKLYLRDSSIWGTLIIFVSFQLWCLMATLEAFRIQRTSWPWRILYFFYPVVVSFAFPIFLILYLADQIYLISRAGLVLQTLKDSSIRRKFFPFFYRNNLYPELWMPGILGIALSMTFSVVSMAAMAAIGIVVVLVCFELLAICYVFLMPTFVIWQERSVYHTAMANLQRIDLIPLIGMIEKLKTRRYRLGLLASVLDKQYLIPSPENCHRIRVLVAFIQSALSSEYTAHSFIDLVAIDKNLAQALGYVDPSSYKLANYWDEDQLDLLCKISEQLQK